MIGKKVLFEGRDNQEIDILITGTVVDKVRNKDVSFIEFAFDCYIVVDNTNKIHIVRPHNLVKLL